MEEEPIVTCPHCKEPVLIKEVNCAIFRHGIYKNSGKQIGPHSSKEKCEALVRDGKIYGCGKPFQVKQKEDKQLEAVECDYI